MLHRDCLEGFNTQKIIGLVSIGRDSVTSSENCAKQQIIFEVDVQISIDRFNGFTRHVALDSMLCNAMYLFETVQKFQGRQPCEVVDVVCDSVYVPSRPLCRVISKYVQEIYDACTWSTSLFVPQGYQPGAQSIVTEHGIAAGMGLLGLLQVALWAHAKLTRSQWGSEMACDWKQPPQKDLERWVSMRCGLSENGYPCTWAECNTESNRCTLKSCTSRFSYKCAFKDVHLYEFPCCMFIKKWKNALRYIARARRRDT